jgi:hypothetical protein
MHNPTPRSMRITCGQRHFVCGRTADNQDTYTQASTHNPQLPTQLFAGHVNNHFFTHNPHTVFTQPYYTFLSVTGCLYTLSTFPTKNTITKE